MGIPRFNLPIIALTYIGQNIGDFYLFWNRKTYKVLFQVQCCILRKVSA